MKNSTDPIGIFLLSLCPDCPYSTKHTTLIFMVTAGLSVVLCTSCLFLSSSSLSCILSFCLYLQHKHPFYRQDSNPQSQQAIDLRPSPRTLNPRKPAAEDPRLRPFCHWDRQSNLRLSAYPIHIYHKRILTFRFLDIA
jgi:hypothetical protein